MTFLIGKSSTVDLIISQQTLSLFPLLNKNKFWPWKKNKFYQKGLFENRLEKWECRSMLESLPSTWKFPDLIPRIKKKENIVNRNIKNGLLWSLKEDMT